MLHNDNLPIEIDCFDPPKERDAPLHRVRLLGLDLGGDSSPRIVAFQARLEF